MSNALAIAATTAVLRGILQSGLVRAQLSPVISSFSVSALPPDRIDTSANEPNQLNLFMYQATHNPGWRNVDLPSRDRRGERISNPPLSLDLHYLLSAYGSADLHAEILLGVGMHLLHEMPVLTRAAIRDAFTPPVGGSLPATLQALAAAGLAEQLELVKICPAPLSTDEMSKLWSAFQDKYRPCAAYTATVVLIETRAPTRESLPVQRSILAVKPMTRPAIESIEPPMVDFAPGATVAIRGSDLLAPDTIVLFGGSGSSQPLQSPAPASDRLVVPLPATVRAGVNTVQVVHQVELSEPKQLRRAFESNVAALVVRPAIAKRPEAGAEVDDVTPLPPQDSGTPPPTETITVGIRPPVGKRQRVELLLNEPEAPDDRPGRYYTFEAPSRDVAGAPETTDTITFPIRDVLAGDYLLRVRVDGADSSLVAAPPGSNPASAFAGPRVSVT